MHTTTRRRGRDTARAFVTRYLPPTLAAGSGSILVAGCAVVVATAVGAAVVALTGLFLGSIQATFAATARSYAFTDTGPVQLMFSPPEVTQVSLVRYQGRLPGFHLAIITAAEKDRPRAQADEIVFETDVNIDFEATPPTITGTIQERDGGEPVDLRVLYPAIVSVESELSEPDDDDQRQLTVTIVAQAADGAQLEYTLTMQTRLAAEGSVLDGDVEVERVYTPGDDEPLVVEADGTFEVTKLGATPPDAGLEDDNANEDDNTNDNEEPDVENDNLDDEPANENVDDEPVDDGAGTDGVEPAEPTPASACIPGLSEVAAQAVDLFVESGGKAGLDGDGDGTVTSAEVQTAINPVLAPFFLEVSPGAAGCIAELVNSEGAD
ncbi:MAG: hypothetical protein GY778_27810 [bacterium]|nr:hypothetical protein [bacterium]